MGGDPQELGLTCRNVSGKRQDKEEGVKLQGSQQGNEQCNCSDIGEFMLYY